MPDSRQLLRALYDAAVAAADPYPATRDAITACLSNRADDGRAWIIATGKAAPRMAAAALDAARETDLEIAGGIVVSHEHADVAPPLEHALGDHPIPGDRSQRAAMRIGALVNAVLPRDHVVVLVSGGTSSLIAAPADGVSHDEFATTMRDLLGSGLDIHAMNTIRRRILRWSGGRLGAELAPAHVHQVLLSDVIGDDPAIIGSGPCVPDAGITLAHVDPPVVLGRTMIHDGVARAALSLGVTLHLHEEPLVGPAHERGAELAAWLSTDAHAGVHCWTGETTVALGGASGKGGRCQELALATALALPSESTVALLAAGTDGRDGPTDAAGAVIDATMVAAMRSAGVDAHRALDAHDSYRALDAAGALLRTGATGTNVADIVLAVVG